MKRKLILLVLILGVTTLFTQNVNSQSTCQGIYHDGVASNSWLGDNWDDAFNLDWEKEAKPCFSKITVKASGGAGLTTTASIDVIAEAASEVAGCGGGNGSCCEQLCTSGAGW